MTGEKADIDSLLRALGAAAANADDHTPMILISNDVAGYRTRSYGLSSPAALVKVIDGSGEPQDLARDRRAGWTSGEALGRGNLFEKHQRVISRDKSRGGGSRFREFAKPRDKTCRAEARAL